MIEFIESALVTVSHGPFPFLSYALVCLIVFAESGLFFGFFLPGDSLLLTVGAIAALPASPFSIWLLLPALFLSAVLGDSVGYWFGNKAGARIFRRPESRFFKPKYLKQARAFYDQHGGKTILLARFMPFVRTFAPIVAGAVRMEYARFLVFNLAGGCLWTIGVTLAGYLFGNMPFVKNNLEVALVLIVLLSVAPVVIHRIRERQQEKPAPEAPAVAATGLQPDNDSAGLP